MLEPSFLGRLGRYQKIMENYYVLRHTKSNGKKQNPREQLLLGLALSRLAALSALPTPTPRRSLLVLLKHARRPSNRPPPFIAMLTVAPPPRVIIDFISLIDTGPLGVGIIFSPIVILQKITF